MTPAATTATTPTSASTWRQLGANRRRAASQRTTAPSARPPAAATRAGEDEAEHAGRECQRRRAVRAGRLAPPGDDAGRGEGRARPPTSAARSWWPRNDGCRQPAFHAPKMSSAEELQERDGDCDCRPTGRARPARSSGPRRAGRGAARRPRAGAYSTSLRKLTRWSSKSASSSETGRNVWNASHARRAAPADPQPARGAQREPARSRGRERRGDDDDEDGEVREPDVDRRRAAPDAEVGLVALVEEEERDRAREDERAERFAIDEGAEAGGRRARCPTPRWPPRHYRAPAPAPDPVRADALPTLTPRCPLGSSGAGRRRLRGSTPLSRAASSGRSSRRASSGSTSSACSRPRSSSWASSRRCSTSRSRSR